jgi:hypothetical protein
MPCWPCPIAAIPAHNVKGSRKNVTVHGVVRAAPRPARLPNKTRHLYSIVQRQPCGEGLGETGLASLGERVKVDRSGHELGKISLSWDINYGLRQ